MVEFETLLNESRSLSPLPATNKKQLTAYVNISGDWITLAKQQLPLISALAGQPFDLQAPLKHLWIRHIALYLLVGLRNRVNHQTMQQGVAALLSFYRIEQSNLSSRALLKARQQLSLANMPYWADKVCPPSLTTSHFTDCFDTAWYCKAALTKRPSQTISELISLLGSRLSLSGYKHLAELLYYPGVSCEGSMVLNQQLPAMIVGQQQDSLLVFYLADERFEQVAKSKVRLLNTNKRSARQWLHTVKKLDQQPDEGELFVLPDHQWAIPNTYPIGKPPESLLLLLRALNDPSVAVQKIVSLVEGEPAFSDFLNSAASKDNRLQLPVENVKQSILTYGLDRVGNMLVQYALFQRLTQQHFPLAEWFSSFTQIAATCSSELATISGYITPQSAGLATTIIASPLFTLSELKCWTTLPGDGKMLFDIAHLAAPDDPDQTAIRQRLQLLSTAWQQDKAFSKLFAYCGKLPSEVPSAIRAQHCITGLSLIWTRQWLFAHQPCSTTQQFIDEVKKAFPGLIAQQDIVRHSVLHQLVCPLR